MKTDYICEQVYVETPVDTDGDGKLDLIRVFIKRPVSTDKVPAVFVANPYLLHCNEDWYNLHDVNVYLKAYGAQNITADDIRYDVENGTADVTAIKNAEGSSRITESVVEENPMPEYTDIECISPLYDSLVERGYAAVYSGGLGTRGSDGFVVSGSREEILAFKSVIEWLNGNARAFTALDSNIEVKANWCTGSVAMSGKSYLGTLCIGVAMTGVEGLKTIIPEAGIANWYDYYRTNGLVCPPLEWQGDDIDLLSKYCLSRTFDAEDYEEIKDDYAKKVLEIEKLSDRDSGNYNKFWDERNYLNQIDNLKASVFIIQGLNDFNVKPTHAIGLFKKLEEVNAERKMLLHRGEHVYTYKLEGAPTLELVYRWLDHYLKGIDNGIEKESQILIEDDRNQLKWRERSDWNTGKTIDVASTPSDESECERNSDDFVIYDSIDEIFDRETSNYTDWRDAIILNDSIHAVRIENPLDEDLRISGDIKVEFSAKINQRTAVLSAMLVDLGEDKRLTGKMIGEQYEGFRFEVEEEPSQYRIITRGHLNAQNRRFNYTKEYIDPDEYYSYSFNMIPIDYTVNKGSSLVLIIYGVDPEQTVVSGTKTEIHIKKNSVKCTIGVE